MATTHHHEPDDRRRTTDTIVEVPIRPEAILPARRAVQRAAAHAGLHADRIDDLLVAVSEAVTNAFEANQRARCDEPIVVTCSVVAGSLEVTITDCGAGFEPAELPVRPPLADPGHLDVERGWGIQLMRALVDELVFDVAGAGTTVCLRMALPV